MATLNNPTAYAFVNSVVSNTIIELFKTLNIKASKVVSSCNKYQTVEVKIPTIGKVACLSGNVKDNTLALSMHHIMNCQNICFIYNNTLYIIKQDILQMNWNNLITTKKIYLYTDGTGTQTSMTPADVNVLINIASYKYEIPDDILKEYNQKKEKYF